MIIRINLKLFWVFTSMKFIHGFILIKIIYVDVCVILLTYKHTNELL